MNRESEKSLWRELEEVVYIDCVSKVSKKKRERQTQNKEDEAMPFNWSILYMKEGIYLTAIH